MIDAKMYLIRDVISCFEDYLKNVTITKRKHLPKLYISLM